MKRNYNLLVLAGAALLFASCAKEVNESADEMEKRLIEAYVATNDGIDESHLMASGLYFIPEEPRFFGTSPSGSDFIYMHYTSRTLSGVIGTTTVDSLNKMLGNYSRKNYYGPQLYTMEAGAGIQGLQEGFSYMAPGDKARILMPSRLSSYVESGARAHGAATIYDLELLRVVPDMAAFQTDSLKQYSNIHFGGEDSLKYDWYFISTMPGLGELPEAGDTIKVRYAGYFLDGFLFDTNIKAVMDLHWGDHQSGSESQGELSVIMTDDAKNMGVVLGFAYALQRMRNGGAAVTFFSSDYGYGANSQGTIQPYSMLRFDIDVTLAKKITEITEKE
jgi:FKBP-type peptidyl-prolyl cis-trans isomerase